MKNFKKNLLNLMFKILYLIFFTEIKTETKINF